MPSKKPKFFGIHADSEEEAEKILLKSGKPNPKKEAELREYAKELLIKCCPRCNPL